MQNQPVELPEVANRLWRDERLSVLKQINKLNSVSTFGVADPKGRAFDLITFSCPPCCRQSGLR